MVSTPTTTPVLAEVLPEAPCPPLRTTINTNHRMAIPDTAAGAQLLTLASLRRTSPLSHSRKPAQCNIAMAPCDLIPANWAQWEQLASQEPQQELRLATSVAAHRMRHPHIPPAFTLKDRTMRISAALDLISTTMRVIPTITTFTTNKPDMAILPTAWVSP